MLKNKFVVGVFIVLIIFTIFTSNVLGFSTVYNDVVYDFGDDIELYDYTFAKVAYLYTDDTNFLGVDLVTLDKEPYIEGSSYSFDKCNLIIYRHYNGVVNKQVYTDYGCSSFGKLTSKLFLYSNFDIKDKEGNVVFRKPVLSLGEVLANNNPVKTFQTTMSGIILSLTVLLVLLVGFLKAWSLLSRCLRKA